MSSVPSPFDKISVKSEIEPQRDGTEGTVDRLNEAPQDYKSWIREIARGMDIPTELLEEATASNYSEARMYSLRDCHGMVYPASSQEDSQRPRNAGQGSPPEG